MKSAASFLLPCAFTAVAAHGEQATLNAAPPTMSASFTEVVPALPGLLEMQIETSDAQHGTATSWEFTNCDTGRVVTIATSATGSAADFDYRDALAATRAALFERGTNVDQDDIATQMMDLGANMTETTNEAFEATCALRGRGQLGGILN
jgi:hypothetical protein